jgi:O-succinylbenzoate synthase
MALDLKSGRFLNLKQGRVGGLTAALAILEACRAGGVSCWGGAVPQSAIGSRIGLALAAKAGRAYPADFFPASDVLVEDLAEPIVPIVDPSDGVARLTLWKGAGLGVEPDAAVLERFTLQKVVC